MSLAEQHFISARQENDGRSHYTDTKHVRELIFFYKPLYSVTGVYWLRIGLQIYRSMVRGLVSGIMLVPLRRNITPHLRSPPISYVVKIEDCWLTTR